MVDVARFGEADDRVDEDVGMVRARSTDGEFAVGPVHGGCGFGRRRRGSSRAYRSMNGVPKGCLGRGERRREY